MLRTGTALLWLFQPLRMKTQEHTTSVIYEDRFANAGDSGFHPCRSGTVPLMTTREHVSWRSFRVLVILDAGS